MVCIRAKMAEEIIRKCNEEVSKIPTPQEIKKQREMFVESQAKLTTEDYEELYRLINLLIKNLNNYVVTGKNITLSSAALYEMYITNDRKYNLFIKEFKKIIPNGYEVKDYVSSRTQSAFNNNVRTIMIEIIF